jgi:hypothetical protein
MQYLHCGTKPPLDGSPRSSRSTSKVFAEYIESLCGVHRKSSRSTSKVFAEYICSHIKTLHAGVLSLSLCSGSSVGVDSGSDS